MNILIHFRTPRKDKHANGIPHVGRRVKKIKLTMIWLKKYLKSNF